MNKWRLLLAAVAAGLLVAMWQGGLFSLVANPEQLRAELLGMGAWGYLAFILAFAFLQPLGLPGIAFVIGATYVWPRPVAYGLSLVGSLAGSAIGFGFARFIAHDWVAARLPKKLRKYDAWIETRGLLTTAGLRAVFLMHPLLHALFGISRIRFSVYMLGCALGYIPSLAVVTWASGSVVDILKEQPKERFFLIVGVIVGLFVAKRVGTWWWRKRRGIPAEASAEDEPALAAAPIARDDAQA